VFLGRAISPGQKWWQPILGIENLIQGGLGWGGGTLASQGREWMDPQNIVLISHP
jgi:hypothetical protein